MLTLQTARLLFHRSSYIRSLLLMLSTLMVNHYAGHHEDGHHDDSDHGADYEFNQHSASSESVFVIIILDEHLLTFKTFATRTINIATQPQASSNHLFFVGAPPPLLPEV